MREKLPELIKLQHAHVNQQTTGTEKTPWFVQANITNEALATLPGHLSEAHVFVIIGFAKKYEMIAWNMGIAFGKEKQQEVYAPVIEELKSRLQHAIEENERLAEALDKHIRSEV